MTRNEQIDIASLDWWMNEVNQNGDAEMAFKAGAAWADAHPRWISVDDELPKGVINDNVTKMVLTFSADGYIRLDRYMHYYHRWVNGASEVTHWMPTPQPPKKGGEQ